MWFAVFVACLLWQCCVVNVFLLSSTCCILCVAFYVFALFCKSCFVNVVCVVLFVCCVCVCLLSLFYYAPVLC